MSIVTLATSRANCVRVPLAVMSMFSCDVDAVELKRVGAVLALDGIVAVARVPDEGVVAAATEQGVVAAAAGDDVVAIAAEQPVVASRRR
jgi:hypothetical protein